MDEQILLRNLVFKMEQCSAGLSYTVIYVPFLSKTLDAKSFCPHLRFCKRSSIQFKNMFSFLSVM